ncbi:MAG: hypothetical protein AAFN42_01570 [Cyanobacteria bacterium J06554_1]
MTNLYKIAVGFRASNVNPGVISRACIDRVIEPLDFLKSLNIVDYKYAKSPKDLESLKQEGYTFFMCNKSLSKYEYELIKYAKKLGYITLYDVDDYIFEYPSYSNANSSSVKVEEFTKIADCITVANERLFYAFQPYGITRLICNTYNFKKYSAHNNQKSYTSRKVVITNADNFKLTHFRQDFFSLLRKMITEKEISELHVFADFLPDELDFPGIHYHGYVEAEKHRRILSEQDFHLALVPIDSGNSYKDWNFNSSKNPFKYFIYGTSKVPAIYSNIAFYTLHIQDEYNGKVVSNNLSSWKESMLLLLNNPLMCSSIASNAFLNMKEQFDIATMKRQYTDLFNELTK